MCQFWVTHRLQDVPRIRDPSHLVTQRRNERRIGASRLSRQYRPEFELHRRYNSSTYTEDILKSAVRLGQDFQEALPLLPAWSAGPMGSSASKEVAPSRRALSSTQRAWPTPLPASPLYGCPLWRFSQCGCFPIPSLQSIASFPVGWSRSNSRGGTDDWKFSLLRESRRIRFESRGFVSSLLTESPPA